MNQPARYILAIESSCDDTAAAVFMNDKVLANVVADQKVHKQWGGIVPELASRAHTQQLIPVVNAALKKADITKEQLSAVAVTECPGLIGSLLVGTSFAKALSLSLGIPLIGVNHIQAHVMSHFIEDPKPPFPFICLTVSGGHTQLILVRDFFDMEIIGQTLDDAAGEAFDKVAKIFGLPYPGGPLIDQLAVQGDPLRFDFAEPQVEGLNFSFSGFKTSVLYTVQNNQKKYPHFVEENIFDLCASVQYKIVKMLMEKLEQASALYNIRHIAVAGGVSANTALRMDLYDHAQKKSWHVYIPRFEYCTDNAAMIGMVAYYKLLQNKFSDLHLTPKAKCTFFN